LFYSVDTALFDSLTAQELLAITAQSSITYRIPHMMTSVI